MAVYVDFPNPMWAKDSLSCHMMTDGDLSELHEMAIKIGLKHEWFQDHPFHPHYDLSANKRNAAITAGAIPVTSREMVLECSKFKSDSKKPSSIAMMVVKKFLDEHHGEPISIILHRGKLEQMVDKAIEYAVRKL